MNTYLVKRGPVSLPASLYGQERTLGAGDTFQSGPNPWLRRCIRDGRVIEQSQARKAKDKK